MAARKKAAAKKQSTSRKKSARSTRARRPAAKGRKRAVKRKRAAKKKTAKKSTARSRPARKSTRKRNVAGKRKVKKPKSLGRARLPADSRLDLVFQKDYQAREVFEFLRVHTLRELEEWSPDAIIEKLTGPLVQTIERIRKTLAMSNRCLANDRKFALAFKAQLKRR